MSGIFSYSELTEFLRSTSSRYRFWNFRDWKGENGVLLRHDIDFNLDAALRMAQLESSIDIPATFFIMISSGFYNSFSMKNREIIREIVGMGFDIGLHFDPQIYADESDLVGCVDREASWLSSISDVEVKSVSLHNPSVRNEYPLFEKYRNAYEPAIFSNENYLSDSCMDFRGKDPVEFLLRAERKPVQLLLHPMHYSERGDDYPKIMEKYLLDLASTIDRDFAVNWKFSEQMAGQKVADQIRKVR
jgi:hypothetical protein